jgi:copper(I)-binding protein
LTPVSEKPKAPDQHIAFAPDSCHLMLMLLDRSAIRADALTIRRNMVTVDGQQTFHA